MVVGPDQGSCRATGTASIFREDFLPASCTRAITFVTVDNTKNQQKFTTAAGFLGPLDPSAKVCRGAHEPSK